jgi:acyl-CoA thioesterase FadM
MAGMDFAHLPLTLQAEVKPEYVDTLDHMNVMWYTHLFDQATWNFYDSFGFGREYHAGPNGSFALELYVRHLAELRLGEQLSVYSRAVGRRGKLLHIMHIMRRERDDVLSAASEMLGIHVALATRRSTSFPEDMADTWDALIAEHQRLTWPVAPSGKISL